MLEGQTLGQSHSVGQLGGQGDLIGEHPQWRRQVAAGRVADVVEQEAVEDLGSVAAQRQRLAVLGYDPAPIPPPTIAAS